MLKETTLLSAGADDKKSAPFVIFGNLAAGGPGVCFARGGFLLFLMFVFAIPVFSQGVPPSPASVPPPLLRISDLAAEENYSGGGSAERRRLWAKMTVHNPGLTPFILRVTFNNDGRLHPQDDEFARGRGTNRRVNRRGRVGARESGEERRNSRGANGNMSRDNDGRLAGEDRLPSARSMGEDGRSGGRGGNGNAGNRERSSRSIRMSDLEFVYRNQSGAPVVLKFTGGMSAGGNRIYEFEFWHENMQPIYELELRGRLESEAASASAGRYTLDVVFTVLEMNK